MSRRIQTNNHAPMAPDQSPYAAGYPNVYAPQGQSNRTWIVMKGHHTRTCRWGMGMGMQKQIDANGAMQPALKADHPSQYSIEDACFSTQTCSNSVASNAA
jgi:hypothetical protein